MIATNTTDGFGRYTWTDLTPGEYWVAEEGREWCHLASGGPSDDGNWLNVRENAETVVKVYNCDGTRASRARPRPSTRTPASRSIRTSGACPPDPAFHPGGEVNDDLPATIPAIRAGTHRQPERTSCHDQHTLPSSSRRAHYVTGCRGRPGPVRHAGPGRPDHRSRGHARWDTGEPLPATEPGRHASRWLRLPARGHPLHPARSRQSGWMPRSRFSKPWAG